MNNVAKRYTSALIESASEKEIALYAEIFQALSSSLEEKKAKEVFFSPYMSSTNKEAILLAAVASVKSERLNNFIKLLVEKKRTNIISSISAVLSSELEKIRNSYLGVIESNIALSAEKQKAFEDNFAKKIDSNVTFDMKNSTYDGVKISVDSLGLEVGFSKTIVRDQMIQHILKSI